jgi:hypothetical protein
MVRELKFTNRDATPKTVILKVETESVEPIMAWYGAYHSGDRYTVHVDRVKVKKDQNGELVGSLS